MNRWNGKSSTIKKKLLSEYHVQNVGKKLTRVTSTMLSFSDEQKSVRTV